MKTLPLGIGLLHFVGNSAAVPDALRAQLDKLVAPLSEAPGFTGRSPVSDSRHGGARPRDFEPLRPSVVCQVEFDRFVGDHFRHPPTLLKLLPPKSLPRCTFKQVRPLPKLVDKGLEVLGL